METLQRKLVEANERIVEFETIKKAHLTEIETLKDNIKALTLYNEKLKRNQCGC